MRQEITNHWVLLAKFYLDWDFKGEAGSKLIESAKQGVFSYIWDKMRKYGEFRPPFLHKPEESQFVKAQGVKKIISSDITGYGYLLRDGDQFIIVINKGLGEIKRRTIIAHELGHTFLLKANIKTSVLPYGYDYSRHLWKTIEGPAFEIGRQILVPKQSLPASLSKSVTLKKFLELKKEYRASKDIIALRLIHDLKLWDAYLFFTTYDPNKGNVAIPKNHERFKGNSFKRFNLNRNWTIISDVLKRNFIKVGGFFSENVVIKKNSYQIQGLYEKGNNIICLIKNM
ncbi:MAG: ImmA/IrrE family metallo-endopeptidase [Candidatus Bathyarchaeia archaeon]